MSDYASEQRQSARLADAAILAASWAQRLQLPAGNLWEPAIVRQVWREYQQLGASPEAWAFTVALWRMRLGLEA